MKTLNNYEFFKGNILDDPTTDKKTSIMLRNLKKLTA